MGLLSWLRPKREALTTRATADYETFYQNWQPHAMGRRPAWSYFMADLMLLDHQVWFAACIGNAPLITAEVEVTGPSREVNQFVRDQHNRLWTSSVSHVLRSKYFGYIGLEVTFTQTDRGWEIASAVSRHPRDTRPLFAPEDLAGVMRAGDLIGVRFRGIGRSMAEIVHSYANSVDLPLMKSAWLTYDAEYGQMFGRASLERSYGAWWDKAMPGGAYDLRRLRNVKDSWIGDVLKYPLMKKYQMPDGTEISARDLARQIGEARVSGGVVVIPNDKDPKDGNPFFEYQPPQTIAGENHASGWIEELDFDIYDGQLIPREIVEAAATGSGFSGRSIPMVMFLSSRDLEFSNNVRELDTCVYRPQVRRNFGEAAAKEYEITPVPLLETVGELLGGSETGGPIGGGPGQPSQPQKIYVPASGDGFQMSADDSANAPADTIIRAAKSRARFVMGDVRRRIDQLLLKKKRPD